MSEGTEGGLAHDRTEVTWKDSTYLGIRRSRTLVGFVFLVALLAGLLLAMLVPELLLTSDEHRFVLWLFNGFVGAVLFAFLLSIPLAVLYGLWNGGPVLAGAIPLLPVSLSFVGYLSTGALVITVDLTHTLAGAGCATAMSTVRTWMHATREEPVLPTQNYTNTIQLGLVFSTAAVALSTASLWRLSQTAGSQVLVGRWLAVGFAILAACGLVVLGVFSLFPDCVHRLQRET